ncbi:MAG: hypothetical protein Q9209_007391 [Squamulea sp. 1 TL-2023]
MSSSGKGHDVKATEIIENDSPELEEHLRTLSARDSIDGGARDVNIIEKHIAAGHAARQLLLDHPGTRDTFRSLRGFEILLGALDSLVDLFVHPGVGAGPQQSSSHFLSVVFSVLTAALAEHRGNQTYWHREIPQGGWKTLEIKLQTLRQSSSAHSYEKSQELEQHIYGCLIACAVDDESIQELFKHMEINQNANKRNSNEPQATTKDANASLTKNFRVRLDRNLGTAAHMRDPEPLCLALKLWLKWELETSDSGNGRNASVVQTVTYLASLSTHNLIALHRTNTLSILLLSLLNSNGSSLPLTELYELVKLLLSLGITKLDDAKLLFSAARSSSTAADLLLHALRSSHSPPYFHFDLSICGYSSIELSDIGKGFPPTNSSNGYTISLWLQIGRFDFNAHTTLFGAFDPSQTCFILIYLEKDSQNLILQTSVTSTRPSVRFKTVSFHEGRWYHIALAHRRPMATSSSRVSLYVNGNFVEQVKSNYPLAPPMSKLKGGSANHVPSGHRCTPVQAFVGTPQDLASRLGAGVVSSQWRLASAYVFGDILSDNLLAVHCELGPRYFGNYQDCLGSFNTYQAASSLKIRNDSLHLGKKPQSEIIRAMETGASELLPEKRIILGLSPWNVLNTDDVGSHERMHVPVYLSKAAIKTTRNLGHRGHDYFVVNGAIPTFNDAFRYPYGFAVPTGSPAVNLPQSLDDAAWQIGGCTAIMLDHLERSDNEDATLGALSCIFECIRDNWRCSEAMEKDNGFAILSALISRKINTRAEELNDDRSSLRPKPTNEDDQAGFPLKVLTAILNFLGMRPNKPENSVLNNPLAYRVLIVDADYWRSMPARVQELYYEQFEVFGIRSKYHNFNAKRLSKMRIIKKWLDALKTDTFKKVSFGFFLNAFKSLLAMNMAADQLRSLAMYITYAVEQGQKEAPCSQDKIHSLVVSTSPAQSLTTQVENSDATNSDHTDLEVSTSHRAVRLLELYADLLCMPGDNAHIAKFTKIVTNKVCLVLVKVEKAILKGSRKKRVRWSF